jgi:hypothetical protein
MVEDRMYVFAGCHGKYACLKDLYYLDLAGLLQTEKCEDLRWGKVELKGEITERWGHTTNYYNGDIFVFGGRSSEDMNDLAAISLADGAVRRIGTSQ